MALIECPDCGRMISDLAQFCIGCGRPINSIPSRTPPLKRAIQRHKPMRRANGTGSIRHLSGNRRNPYAAYPPVTAYNNRGSGKLPKAIGYFETYNDALDALTEYMRNPYDLSIREITFAEVYDKFIQFKFVNSKKQYSKNLRAVLNSAYKHCEPLYDIPFISIRPDRMQKVLDDCPLKRSSLEHILSLFHQLSEYACQMGICEKDYSQYVRISIPEDNEKGDPFFEEELKILWSNKNDDVVKIILIMIYSGFRIVEFETLKINLEEQYFQGGVKTDAGKNRIVPIHPAISPFVTEETFKGFKAKTFRERMKSKLVSLGIGFSINGKVHTPHDTRHTFSWLCDKFLVNNFTKHLLMGHAIQGDVENTVYGHRTIQQLETEIRKIKAPEDTSEKNYRHELDKVFHV